MSLLTSVLPFLHKKFLWSQLGYAENLHCDESGHLAGPSEALFKRPTLGHKQY